MTTPFYERDGITIYCGDCRNTLAKLKGIDLLLADPPYGINSVVNGKTFSTSNATPTNDYKPVYDDDKPFNPSHLLNFSAKTKIIWGANHFANLLPSSSGWLVWDKRDGTNSNPLADCELAWTNIDMPARLFSHRWMGMIRDSERQRRVHPNQKPIVLMKWCISLANPNGLICDPYMGSGTTLVAAKQLGYPAIGIEISEEYCRIAVDRLRQPSFFSLPAMTPKIEPEQATMFEGIS